MGKMNKLDVVPQYKLFEDLFEKLVESIPKNKKKLTILDLGCGNKPYEQLFKNHFKDKIIEYIGIDFYSKEANLKLDINNQKIPFKNNYFDIIICTEVLEHLYKPLFVIDEIKRLSKKSGFILITTPFFFPIHEKKHDYFRYTYNFYEYIFSDLKIIKENISNTFLSMPLYLVTYFLGNKIKSIHKIIGILAKPIDKLCLFLFKNKYITYSYYMDYGILIKNEKK